MRLTPSILENSIRYITIFVGHRKPGKKKRKREDERLYRLPIAKRNASTYNTRTKQCTRAFGPTMNWQLIIIIIMIIIIKIETFGHSLQRFNTSYFSRSSLNIRAIRAHARRKNLRNWGKQKIICGVSVVNNLYEKKKKSHLSLSFSLFLSESAIASRSRKYVSRPVCAVCKYPVILEEPCSPSREQQRLEGTSAVAETAEWPFLCRRRARKRAGAHRITRRTKASLFLSVCMCGATHGESHFSSYRRRCSALGD